MALDVVRRVGQDHLVIHSLEISQRLDDDTVKALSSSRSALVQRLLQDRLGETECFPAPWRVVISDLRVPKSSADEKRNACSAACLGEVPGLRSATKVKEPGHGGCVHVHDERWDGSLVQAFEEPSKLV